MTVYINLGKQFKLS